MTALTTCFSSSESNVYDEDTGEWIGNIIDEAHG
jgi:hypothetical protein